VRRIGDAGQIGRLRLSSIEPLEVTDELIACLRDSTVLCRHLHIPLQSGDDRILASMGRHYDREFFRGRVERLVSEFPDLAIGYRCHGRIPGEGDHEFENTMACSRELPVAYLHVFPYSERPGTAHRACRGKVEERVRAARAAELRGLGLAKREAFVKRLAGSREVVLGRREPRQENRPPEGIHRQLHPGVPERAAARA